MTTSEPTIKIGELDTTGFVHDSLSSLSLIAQGKMIVTVHSSGEVEFGKDISIDEGKEFYCLLAALWTLGNPIKREQEEEE